MSKDRLLTDREMCGVKFNEHFMGDSQLCIDDTSRHYIYRRPGPCTEEYLGYSDPERQRPHSRFWGLSRKEMYALLWQEFRAKQKGAYSDLLRRKG